MRYLREKKLVQLHQKLDEIDEMNLKVTTSKTINKPIVLIGYDLHNNPRITKAYHDRYSNHNCGQHNTFCIHLHFFLNKFENTVSSK